MTHRTCTRLPSTPAATRNATSGGRKSLSFDSTPRIHQGLAVAAPVRPISNKVSNKTRIASPYSSRRSAGLPRAQNVVAQQKITRPGLELAESIAMISSHRWRVLTTPPLSLPTEFQAVGVLSYEDSSTS